MSTISDEFRRLHPRSAELYEKALRVFPSGVTHDIRYFTPFPIYIERASGSRKWDVDGHEIIDYVMGHGALLLGHLHPVVTRAVAEQLGRGTHYGASHELEIEWADWVQRLLPSAEMVHFTSSGTEAVQMALRLARAFTGRDKVIRFVGHFHGWSDHVVGFSLTPEEMPRAVGIPEGILQSQLLVPQNDPVALQRALAEHEVAAVIIEPTGASWGTFPLELSFLAEARRLTEEAGALLIFDEVVTGFRVSPGGVQAVVGVRPDLTTLGKILAGGLPGGAVAGRRDVLALIEFRDDEWNLKRRIAHPGTYNANPLSASAGIATLSFIADGKSQQQAEATTRRLCRGFNQIIRKAGVKGCAYGYSSMFHLLLGRDCPPPDDDFTWHWEGPPAASIPQTPGPVATPLRQGLLNRGADLMRTGGLVSAVHNEEDIDRTLSAFEATLADLRREGVLWS